ncbi:MAG: PIN domain-containing protein [Deltaproteobacteria bacterium]|nr:PIN domain-containing protein [Deltaproteobacteria bacterium]
MVFFAAGKAAQMSRKCAGIFRRAQQQRDRMHVPIVCFFELAMLLERGRVKSSLSFNDWQGQVAQFPGLPIEPLVWEDIREARGLAALVDPFDRLIAGTSIRLDAPLITGDERIRTCGLVRTVW